MTAVTTLEHPWLPAPTVFPSVPDMLDEIERKIEEARGPLVYPTLADVERDVEAQRKAELNKALAPKPTPMKKVAARRSAKQAVATPVKLAVEAIEKG